MKEFNILREGYFLIKINSNVIAYDIIIVDNTVVDGIFYRKTDGTETINEYVNSLFSTGVKLKSITINFFGTNIAMTAALKIMNQDTWSELIETIKDEGVVVKVKDLS